MGRALLPYLMVGVLFGEMLRLEHALGAVLCGGLAVSLALCRMPRWCVDVHALALGLALAAIRGPSWPQVSGGAKEWVVEQRLSAQRGMHRAVCRDRQGDRLLWHSSIPLEVGSEIAAVLRAKPWTEPAHPWDFDAQAFWSGRGIRGQCVEVMRISEKWTWRTRAAQWFGDIQGRLRHRLDPQGRGGDGAGWLVGLAVGDKSGLSREAQKAFSGLGLAHLTAVSGFHVGLVTLLMSGLLWWLPSRIRWPLVVPVVWGYVALCGAPSSAVRAAFMSSLAVLALALGRRGHGLTLLSAVGLFMWWRSPHLIRDVGTQLSFLATAGILIWHAGRSNVQHGNGLRSRWSQALAIPWVATCSTAPVAWPVFGQLPWLFLPANLVASIAVPGFMLLLILIQVLPQEWSHVVAGHVVWMADAAVEAVVCLHERGPALKLPRSHGALRWIGALLCIGTWAAASRGDRRWMGVCVVLLTAALLRLQSGLERAPEVHVLAHSGERVVLVHGRASVFPLEPIKSARATTWKTRSLVERVSSKPRLPTRHAGDVLVWTPHALMLRLPQDTVLWVSSSASPFR